MAVQASRVPESRSIKFGSKEIVVKPSERTTADHANEARELNDMLEYSKSLCKAVKFGGHVETRIEEGEARQVLVQQAIVRGADYLLLGCRGVGKVAAVLGSVSDYVVRHAPCPVLIVRDTSK